MIYIYIPVDSGASAGAGHAHLYLAPLLHVQNTLLDVTSKEAEALAHEQRRVRTRQLALCRLRIMAHRPHRR